MDANSVSKIEILWGEAPIILTRDVVFAAKYIDGIPALTPGSVMLLPNDAVLLKPAPQDKPSPSEHEERTVSFDDL